MREHVPRALRRSVVRRAAGRCEYCGLSQVGQEATFHVDHVTPVAAGGSTIAENLALACVSCSLRRGARQEGLDPETGHLVPLFNPRQNVWHQDFRWQGTTIVPLSATGRATVEALSLNRPVILEIRREEALLGRHPPSGG